MSEKAETQRRRRKKKRHGWTRHEWGALVLAPVAPGVLVTAAAAASSGHAGQKGHHPSPVAPLPSPRDE